MTPERISILFYKYMDGSATEAELLELSALTLLPANAPVLKNLEQEFWEKMQAVDYNLSEEEIEKLMNAIGRAKPATVRWLNWRRVAIAASIILCIGAGGYLLYFNMKKNNADEIVKKEQAPYDIKAPETDRATITLNDGSTLLLDSTVNEQTALQENIKLVKLTNGQIAYQAVDNKHAGVLQYNTLSNPRGSKVIEMILADGSHVWLNAGSSMAYPVANIGNERKVRITGEAYFEVAKDPKRKFLVEANGTTIEVLGTHFNVNSYDDEESIKITLLEGSVKISKTGTNALLQPGQQASVTNNIEVTNSADIDEVMAWKNGYFMFNRADIKTVMNQLSRWYDVDVVYEKGIPNINLGGEMKRDLNLSQVLKGLGKIGVNFRIEGKKLIVLP